jgi:hypothetical protein
MTPINDTGDCRCGYNHACPILTSNLASHLRSRGAECLLLVLFCWSLLSPFLDGYERVVGITGGNTTGVGLSGSLEVGAS